LEDGAPEEPLAEDGREVDADLPGDFPPDLPPDVPVAPGAGKGPVLGESEPQGGSMLRASIPYVSFELDNLIYLLAWLDQQGRYAPSYRGLSRSEAVQFYLHRVAMADLKEQLESGSYKGLVNAVGEQMLRVMQRAALVAAAQVNDDARQDIITTLVERGIASRARLEEVLGVASSAVA